MAIGASFLAVSVGIFALLSSQLFGPLERITRAIFEFGVGRLAGGMPATDRRDEIGALAREFSGMVARVRGAEASLSERNRTLEGLSSKLSKYLPPQVYRSIFAGERGVELVTERKKLTVFFSDIVDFTATTEELEPEDLTHLLNTYFGEMSNIALAHGATIDKFIGDAMLAFFGDPESKGTREDARACVRMALAMQAKIAELEQRWHGEGIEKSLRVRIGIHTGFCNVGNFGSEERMDYTIIGSPVNLAARLEAGADPGGVLLSFETYALVDDIVDAEERPPIQVKGIDRPIRTYAIAQTGEGGAAN